MIAIQLNKEESQVLIQALYQKEITVLSCSAVLRYLSMTMNNDKPLFLRESLRAALLQDLQETFAFKQPAVEEPSTKNWFHWLEWTLLALSGTIYAACDGFDGITTILALFPNIPLGFIFTAGFAFALLSVFVFYGFYLIDLSNQSHLGSKQQNILIDIRLEQMNAIHDLISANQIILKRSDNLDVLKNLQSMLPVLKLLYLQLHVERNQYELQLKKNSLKLAKGIVAIFSGILFFGYGFFGGQSLALTLMTVFAASTTVTFWPVMIISLLVGLAAWSVYWLVERPNLEKLVGRCFGLDEDKISKLPNKAMVCYQTQIINRMIADLNRHVLKVDAKSSVTHNRSHQKNQSNYEAIRFFGSNHGLIKKRSLSENDLQCTVYTNSHGPKRSMKVD